MDEINNNDPRPMAAIMSRMMADPWDERKPQPAPSLPDWLAPATAQDALLALAPILTLCAPSGMSQDDREEWLAVASDAVSHIPRGLFLRACHHVKGRHDHPAKIIPSINAYCDEHRKNWEWCNRPASKAPRLTVVMSEPKTLRKITQADVDAMPEYMVQLGLTCGALARDESGNVKLTEASQ
jgi:hypothetical protein